MRLMLLLVLTITIFGCTSTYRKQSEPELNTNLPQTKVYIRLDNVKLNTYFDSISWNGSGLGIIGNLTMVAIGNYVENEIASHYAEGVNHLKSEVSPEYLKKTFTNNIPQLYKSLPQLPHLEVYYLSKDENPKIEANESALILTPHFGITDSKLKIQVDLEASLVKHKNNSSSTIVIYKNRFLSQSKNIELISAFRSDKEKDKLRRLIHEKHNSLPSKAQNLPENISKRDSALLAVDQPIDPDEYLVRQLAHWMHNDGKYLEQQLNSGITETFKLLAFDLSTNFNSELLEENYLEKTANGRKWIRLNLPKRAGTLASIPEGQPLEWAIKHSNTVYFSF